MQYYLEHGITLLQSLDTTVNIVACISMLWFLGAILGFKFEGHWKKCLVCALGGICGYLALLLNIDRYLHDRNYTVKLLTFFVYSLFFLKGKIITKVISSILTLEVMLIGTSISAMLFSFFTGLPSMSAYERVGYRYVAFQLFNIIFIFLLYCAVVVFLRKTKIMENRANYFGVTVVGITTILVIFSTSAKQNYYMDNTLLVSIIIGIIFINVAIFYFSVKREKAEQARASLQQQYNFQKDYINDVNDLHQKLRQVKHDMKNHIQCLASMINDDKKDAAISYLEGLSQEVSLNLAHTALTGSDVVNCILDDKFAACRKFNIPYDYVITGDHFKKVKDIDLSIILGNLLDNAIEASQKSESKKILLKICNERGYLKVSVSNAIDSSILEKNPKLETIKPDGENHGLGIKSVENIAEKYNGFIDYYEKDGMFFFSALLSVYKK